MPFIGSIVSSIASKILPNMGAIGKAISAITQGPMGMLGGISSIAKSMGNLFNKIGDFAQTLQKGLGGMFRPSGFGAMPRPTIGDFLKGFMAGRASGFRAGFEAGQKVGQAQQTDQAQQSQQTGGTSRKPGESIEDFISRILNNLIKKTEKNLEDAAKKADSSKKVTQEQQTEIQKLQQQLTQLQQLLQNTMKNFHDTKMNAVRNIAQ